MNEKAEATAAIERAQTELEAALARLAHLPAVDADRLSYAAHALNNYLMVVTTIAHVLRKTAGETAEVRERIDSLGHATSLMTQLVRQLMITQREDRPTLILSDVDLVSVIRLACDEYEPIARAKEISLTRDFPDTTVMVSTDKVALGVVLDNLLSNAVKYSVSGGTIRVRVYRSSNEGVFAISDAGPGITEGDSLDVFGRGKKLVSRPTGGEQSTGYGLAIARDLVNALGARMWFQNEMTGGATFFVAVPFHERT